MDCAVNGAGKRYNLKKGGASIVPSGDLAFAAAGTIAAPCVWRGYNSTIGDASVPRTAAGAVDTTNMPVIALGTSTYEITSTGNYTVFQDLVITGISNASLFVMSGIGAVLENCSITNTSTNASSHTVTTGSGGAQTISGCDIIHAGASGGAAAILLSSPGGVVDGCRITSVSGSGIVHTVNIVTISRCVIYNCGAHGIHSTSTSSTAFLVIVGVTIYGCAGNGVEIVSGYTSVARILGCSITDNGGYGVDANASTSATVLDKTRTRDNATSAHLLDAEWTDAVHGAITTDGGAAGTDYEDVTALDFRLVQDAPGRDTTAMAQNAGACGNKYPDEGGEAAAGGGRLVIFS